MAKSAPWDNWSEASSLVYMAYGLAILADYECASSICDRKGHEAAQSAIVRAARLGLSRAVDLMDIIEPRESGA